MALSVGLGKDGFTADSIETSAAVRLEKVGDGFAITHSDLICIAKVPNISEAKFAEIAEITKSGCPVSKVLNAKISLVGEAQLATAGRGTQTVFGLRSSSR